jgi:hypothetical protein
MEKQTLSLEPRITVRKPGAPNPERECTVNWMQRARRVLDNPALDVAVEFGTELRKPVVVGQVRYMSLGSTGGKLDSKNYSAQIGKLDRAHV